MDKFYFSKNYPDINNAGNKAKTDIESILSDSGYRYSGLPQTHFTNKVIGFVLNFLHVIITPFRLTKGSILILQYPLKKYYTLLCRLAHLRGSKTITIIHDLGSFRRQKLTEQKEIKRLSQTDYLIVHNDKMKAWLQERGYSRPIGILEIFDYLSTSRPLEKREISSDKFIVNYAGGLSYRKNRFLYQVDPIIRNWCLNLYGNGFEESRITNRQYFTYKGFIPSDTLISSICGDFGLVWDGDSIDTCQGAFGEYLQYNNPHKTSLYLRCHLPVIIWKKAALASFVEENQIGITIDSISELNYRLAGISKEQYEIMRQHTIAISDRLASGHYFRQALSKAEKYLATE